MVDGARLARVALIAAAAAWPLLFLADTHAASAYETACQATIHGTDVRSASVADQAIHLAADQSVTFDVRANDVIENASVSILVGPVPVLTQSLPQSGDARRASSEISVADYATVGTGTYHLLAQVDGCAMAAGVVIDPAGVTPLMAVGAGVVVVGAVTAGAGLAAGARSRGGLGRSIVGGAVLGAGALVVAQQTGAATPETTNAIAWTVLPGAAGGIAHSVLNATRRRGGSGPDTSVGSYEPPVLGE